MVLMRYGLARVPVQETLFSWLILVLGRVVAFQGRVARRRLRHVWIRCGLPPLPQWLNDRKQFGFGVGRDIFLWSHLKTGVPPCRLLFLLLHQSALRISRGSLFMTKQLTFKWRFCTGPQHQLYEGLIGSVLNNNEFDGPMHLALNHFSQDQYISISRVPACRPWAWDLSFDRIRSNEVTSGAVCFQDPFIFFKCIRRLSVNLSFCQGFGIKSSAPSSENVPQRSISP